MFLVRTPQSETFEMAYFVLRSDTKGRGDQRSMIDEANSIVSAACKVGNSKKEESKKSIKRLVFFLLGVIFGLALAVILLLTLGLLR